MQSQETTQIYTYNNFYYTLSKFSLVNPNFRMFLIRLQFSCEEFTRQTIRIEFLSGFELVFLKLSRETQIELNIINKLMMFLF